MAPSHFARTVRDVVDHDTDLFRRELHRSTQTNEPNRSAVLAAVVGDVATRAGWSTLTLIDVGCSMGLNLFPDLVRRASVDDGTMLIAPSLVSNSSISAPTSRTRIVS